MFVPDEVRKSVVFVGYRNLDGMYQLMGTAFFLMRVLGLDRPVLVGARGKGFVYLVTAKHVIDSIRDNNAAKVCVRVNYHDGHARWVETDINDWLFHPTESDSVDVAVLRAIIPDKLDHRSTTITSSATEEIIRETGIGTGDEVFLVGLFANHHGTQRNIPIVRIGNIAAMPEEPVEVRRFGMMDAYLIEARSLGGLSGSPVFVNIPADRAKSLTEGYEFRLSGTVFFLLGLMHGHWDTMMVDEDAITEDARNIQRVNMGIAIVVPVTKILEVIEQPVIKKREEEILRRERKEHLPSADPLETGPSITLDSS